MGLIRRLGQRWMLWGTRGRSTKGIFKVPVGGNRPRLRPDPGAAAPALRSAPTAGAWRGRAWRGGVTEGRGRGGAARRLAGGRRGVAEGAGAAGSFPQCPAAVRPPMDAARPRCHLQPPRLAARPAAPGATVPPLRPPPSACSRRPGPACRPLRLRLLLLSPTAPPQWTPPPQPAGRRRGRRVAAAAAAGGPRVVGRRRVPPGSRRSRGCQRRRSRWRRSCGASPSGSRCPTGGCRAGGDGSGSPGGPSRWRHFPGTGRRQAGSGGGAAGQRREGSILEPERAFSLSRSLKEPPLRSAFR